MALHFSCTIIVVCVFIWITTLTKVSTTEQQHKWHYRIDDSSVRDRQESHIVLLDTDGILTGGRHRRYVAESQPLDEYVHTPGGQKAALQDNVPASRQTKDVKFLDSKPATTTPQAQPGLSDNSASAGRLSPLPLGTTSTVSSPPLTALNKSVIISAEFDNGMGSQTSSTPPVSDDLDFSKYTDELLNNSLKTHNISKQQLDYHVYYNSTFLVDYHVGQSYWVDMTKRDDVRINIMLSKSHRRAATVKLSFDFPFYGHLVRNVTIATGGFLYTGEYVHSWLAATQYIAPLMANFDTGLSNESYIKYVDNGTAFTVQWEKVVLQDNPFLGDFTFQATLHANGDIVFVYQNVPTIIEEIQDDQHPVKVGLSDAYIIDRTIFFVRRKTIYEYHRVNFNKQDIKNWTIIYLNALPTCMEKRDCASCVTADVGFDCKWCEEAGRCSTGMDRKRQEWLHHECDRVVAPTTPQQCQLQEETHRIPAPSAAASPDTRDMGENVRMGGTGWLGAAFVVVLIAGIAIWTLYAYSNPHSYSGQILIRYRPSQWSWRRGEARYTAATIHM